MSKKVILIRHGESVNNVDKREAKLAFNNLTSFVSLPSFSQLRSASSLVSVPMNSPLSPNGHKMVSNLRIVLERTNFMSRQEVELIIHSSLTRAKQTCYGLFSSDLGISILENENIYEKDIAETLGISDITHRIEAFKQFILERKEKCIVVVGHSAFFRKLVGSSIRMKNCEVQEVILSPQTGCMPIGILVEGGDALLHVENINET